MKKNYFLQLLIIFGFSTVVHSQIIFQEDFETTTAGTFPAGWTLFNVDGLTPNYAWATNAWVVNDETPTNKSAASTSWYVPAGIANDWMITPAITLTANNFLIWDAIAPDTGYRDGYEVRISTTTPTIAASSTILFTITEENSTLTNRKIDLSAYNGQTVYISWRNNSTDKNYLLIDNIIVGSKYDGELIATSSPEYTIIPLSQNPNFNSTISVNNIGFNELTNSVVTLKVYLDPNYTTPIYTETTTPISSLIPGASQAVTFSGFTPTADGGYVFNYELTSTETDDIVSNNTIAYSGIVANIYARDNGQVDQTFGFTNAVGGQLGQEFEISNATNIVSVSFALGSGNGSLNGTTTYAKIWDMVAGVPNTVVAQTDLVNITDDTTAFYNANITTGFYTLNPGTYVITIEQGATNLSLAASNEIFTPGTVWVRSSAINSGAWANIETFGLGYNYSFIIRPNFNDLLSSVDNELDSNAVILYPNPTKSYVKVLNNSQQNLVDATIYDISGRNVASYNLNNNLENDLDISKLSSGNYIVIIKSENGQVSKKLIIN